MGNAIKVLYDFFREFIPALKIESLIVGFGLIAMSLCLMLVCVSSGLTGGNIYLALHPGVTVPGIIGGAVLIFLALTLKPVPREEM